MNEFETMVNRTIRIATAFSCHMLNVRDQRSRGQANCSIRAKCPPQSLVRWKRFRANSLIGILAALLPAIFIINPVSGIGVSVSMDNGAAVSEHLNLDDQASFAGTTLLSEGNIVHELEAKGSGNNKIEEKANGADYSVSNKLESSGSFSISSYSAASSESGMMSQNIEMSGDSGHIAASANSPDNNMIVAGGFQGEGGSLSSDLSSISGGRAAIQGTASIAGIECLDKDTLNTVASGDIAMSADGLYTKEEYEKSHGDLGSFGLYAINTENGNNNLARSEAENWRNQLKDQAELAKKDWNQRQEAKKELFDVQQKTEEDAWKAQGKPNEKQWKQQHKLAKDVFEQQLKEEDQAWEQSFKNDNEIHDSQDPMTPGYLPNGGDLNSYKLAGWRWNTLNPQIKMYLRNDANLVNEGLNPFAVANSVTSAANIWEAATSQNLFADTNTVEISTTKYADQYDGSNVIAFKPFSGASLNALAYSRTYYSYATVGGFYSAKESDLSFNTLYNWQTGGTGSNYDVQTVAQHELGHTLGLGDIYGTTYQSDKNEVMNYYTGVKGSLGNGDKTGVWRLYG